MAIREGMWDCPFCGTKGILGRYRACTQCNAPRQEGTKFYLPENAPEVTDPALLAQTGAGPDWYCLHCGGGNSARKLTCERCGAARGSSPSHRVSTYKLEEIPRTAEEATIEAAPPALPKPKASYGEARPWFLWLVGGEILLVIGLALFLLLHPSSIPVVVSGFSWERNVTVERLTTVTENGWSVPTGGRTISRRQERHHYESVFDHYETRYQHICEDVPDGYETETEEVCERVQSGTERYVCGSTDRGDGTFEDEYCDEPVYSTECHTESRQVPKYRQACHDEPYQAPVYRQEPRYATKYTYEVEKWVYSRTPSASGASHNAAWPELSLAANERESGRGEQYVVRFKDKKGQVYSYLPGFEEWQTFEEGQKLRIEADADRRVTQVEVGK